MYTSASVNSGKDIDGCNKTLNCVCCAGYKHYQLDCMVITMQ